MTTPSSAVSMNVISRKHTVRLVHHWVRERTPAAVVRFGEGEARLLTAFPDDAKSIDIAVRKLRRQTGLTFSPKEMFKVKSLLMNALDEADIVGVRVSASFSEEHREWGERIAALYADRLAEGRRSAHVGHCLLNSDLRDALPQLLQAQPQVSVVSCRDLGPSLEGEYGLRDVGVYQVPSQYVVRDVDGPYEAALHDVPIWPDFYRRLRTEITVRDRGEIFLIGAGLFGKDLCVQIRELGGIALDMGSTLDGLAGKVTRGRNRPDFRLPPEVPKIV